MPTNHSSEQPVCSAKPVTMGVSATIDPTDVPMDIDTRQVAKKMPAGKKSAGMALSVSATVASTAPTDLATAAKAPANTKIQIMYMMRGLAAPSEKCVMRSENVVPRVMAMAYTEASKKATAMGMR